MIDLTWPDLIWSDLTWSYLLNDGATHPITPNHGMIEFGHIWCLLSMGSHQSSIISVSFWAGDCQKWWSGVRIIIFFKFCKLYLTEFYEVGVLDPRNKQFYSITESNWNGVSDLNFIFGYQFSIKVEIQSLSLSSSSWSPHKISVP